ncbi:MAG: ABC transporter permease [Synergistales bacterium]|nr:ABC transporter permease [Synergistales bacterium]
MTYWSRRLLGALTVLFFVLTLNFALFRLMPGDPVASLIDPRFSPESKEALRKAYGLDRPQAEQFLLYLRRTVTFDFGLSFISGRPVWQELRNRLPHTVALTGSALALSGLIGTFLGVTAARRRGGLLERVTLTAGALSFSFPSFFLQLLLLLLLAVLWPLFPLRGSVSVPAPQGGALIADYLHHLALPVISLVLLSFGSWALYVRNLMVKILGSEPLFLARAKGLPESILLWRHAFRTALPPLLTLVLLSLPGLLSGAVITETVFSLHGVGRFLLESIQGQDYPAAGGAFYLLALVTVTSNLLADAAYGMADPRIRFERGRRR